MHQALFGNKQIALISVNTDTHANTNNISTLGNSVQPKFEDHFLIKIEPKIKNKNKRCSYISPLLRSLSSGFICMVTVCSAISEFMRVR